MISIVCEFGSSVNKTKFSELEAAWNPYKYNFNIDLVLYSNDLISYMLLYIYCNNEAIAWDESFGTSGSGLILSIVDLIEESVGQIVSAGEQFC